MNSILKWFGVSCFIDNNSSQNLFSRRAHFQFPYQKSLQDVFCDREHYIIYLKEDVLPLIRKVINWDISSTSLQAEPDEFIIDIHQEKSHIKYIGMRSKFREDKRKCTDGSDRNSQNPDKERIETKELLQLLEDWLAFLEKTGSLVLVEKEWVKDEYRSKIVISEKDEEINTDRLSKKGMVG